MSMIKLYNYIFFHLFMLILTLILTFCFFVAGKLSLHQARASSIYIFKAKVTPTSTNLQVCFYNYYSHCRFKSF